MKKGSIKNTRINAEVRKEIQNVVMNGIKDPRVSAMTTVTDARVTADLRYCTVYVSVLGSEAEAEETLAGFIRSELAHSVNLRITPELKFVLDESMAYGAHIDKVLEELHLSDTEKTEED